jgi:hypothetical protein
MKGWWTKAFASGLRRLVFDASPPYLRMILAKSRRACVEAVFDNPNGRAALHC